VSGPGEDPRARARALADDALARGQPTGWFDPLYREARGDPSRVPWADLAPHPSLAAWLAGAGDLSSARAIVVGCGLGDDAEEVAHRGARTLAFDVSPAAVDWCRARWPRSKVDYTVGDLLAPPPEWRRAFDLVIEIYTVQSLPLALRERALHAVADLAAPGARVVVICRGRGDDEPPSGPPWPLSRRDLSALSAAGLRELSFEDWREPPTPGREPSTVRRFTATYERSTIPE
jgi:hypothetical protein